MTRRTILKAVALTALVPGGTLGCVASGNTSPAPSSSEIYSVTVIANTKSDLPPCTSTRLGTVAYVTMPPTLFACENPGSPWTQLACTTSKSGSVAYANLSPPVLLACLNRAWTPIALPQGEAGPPGPPGPAGPPGEAGAAATITTKQLATGDAHCPAGGVEIDVTSDGVAQAPVFVCNGTVAQDASIAQDAGSDAPPNALQAYAQENAAAFCTQLLECCSGFDSGTGIDFASCVDQEQTVGFENTLPVTRAAYTSGNLTLNLTAASNCIAALPTMSCTTVTAAQNAAIVNACFGVFAGTIPVNAGGCVSSFECASGFCNLPVGGGLGTCTPLVATGGACQTQDMCSQVQLQPTAYCTAQLSPDGGTGTCQPLLTNGLPCLDQFGNFVDMACTAELCGDQSVCGGSFVNPSTGTAGVCSAFPFPPDAGTGD